MMAAKFSNPQLLIIDDDPVAHETIAALLAADRYALLHASGAAEGLRLLSTQAVNAILCDVMMPGITGFSMCGMIRANPAWDLIPIILVSALDGQDDLVRGLEVGADEFLSKPLDRVLLRARIRVVLRIRDRYAIKLGAPANTEAWAAARRDALVTEANLSAREREVLELLLLGRSHADIALVMGISHRTVKFHQANLLTKLGAESRHDLIRLFL